MRVRAIGLRINIRKMFVSVAQKTLGTNIKHKQVQHQNVKEESIKYRVMALTVSINAPIVWTRGKELTLRPLVVLSELCYRSPKERKSKQI